MAEDLYASIMDDADEEPAEPDATDLDLYTQVMGAPDTPSRLDRVRGAAAEEFGGGLSEAAGKGIRRAARSLPAGMAILTGAEELGSLLGTDTRAGRALYEFGSGEEALSPEQISQLPPARQKEARRRQQPAIVSAGEEIGDISQGLAQLPERIAEAPGETALDLGAGMAESMVRTAGRGGLRREAPVSSAGDMLMVGGAPGVAAKAKSLAAPVRPAIRGAGEMALGRARTLRAADATKAEKVARLGTKELRNAIKGSDELVAYKEALDRMADAKAGYEAALGKRLEATPEISSLEQARHFFSKVLDDPAAGELARQAGRDAWAARRASPEAGNVARAREAFKAAKRDAVRLQSANRQATSALQRQFRAAEKAQAKASETSAGVNRAALEAPDPGRIRQILEWGGSKLPEAVKPGADTAAKIGGWLQRRGQPPTPQNVAMAMVALGISGAAAADEPEEERIVSGRLAAR